MAGQRNRLSMALKTLLVFANPYAAIDHNGIPSGSCPSDPEHGGGSLRWPGAVIDQDLTKAEILHWEHRGARSPDQTTRFKFSTEPERIVDTQHHRMCLRCGDLIAADEATAKAGQKDFVKPMAALRAARDLSIMKYRAEQGHDPAFVSDPLLDPWPELGKPEEKNTKPRSA